MTLSITHAKVSAISDNSVSSSNGEVLPSDWNAAHTLTGTISNAQLDGMVDSTIKGRASGGGNGVAQDLTAAQVQTIIGAATSSTDKAIVRFNGTSGGTQNSGITVDDSNNVSGANNIRTKLTADANYYISTTGSDSNAGTASGTAWLTFAHAVSVLKSLDFNGHSVTVNVADGTYTPGLDLGGHTVGQINDGDLLFKGNTTTPANCFIQWTGAAPFNVHDGARCKISGFKVGNGENYCIKVYDGGVAQIANIVYGTVVVAHNQTANGTINVVGNLQITAGSETFVVSEVGNGLFDFGSSTVTLTGTPAFSLAFLNAGENSYIAIHTVTFIGSATGKRYAITDRGAIVPNSLRDSLPGNAAGTDDSAAKTVNGLNVTSTTGTLTIAAGKTLTASNTLTATGTDGSTVAFGAGGTVAYVANNLSVFASTTSAQLAGIISDETGSGSLVFSNSPSLTTPVLGTPSAITLTNGTGLPISTGVSGLGTGIATFLATPSSANLAAALTDETGSGSAVFATSPTLTTPNLGTPSAVTLTNATGLPVSTGISGLGTGVATFLATPSSANLAAAITDETGTGAVVFANSPTLTTPNIGAATGSSLTLNGTIGSSPAVDTSAGSTLNVASSGSATIANSGGYYLMFVCDVSVSGHSALYMGSNGITVLVSTTSGSVWVSPTGTPSAGQLSITNSFGVYKVFAGSGAGCSIRAVVLKAG